MIISFHKDFEKKFKKLPRKTKSKFHERLALFEKDEFNMTLDNHALTGAYKGYRSINVTGDLRAVFKRESKSKVFANIYPMRIVIRLRLWSYRNRCFDS